MLHRHYVVSALNASMATMAYAHAALVKIRATREVYARLQQETIAPRGRFAADADAAAGGEAPLMRLRASLAKLRQLQKKILGYAARRELDAAGRLLHSLQRSADGLKELADEVSATLRPFNCRGGLAAAGGGGGELYWHGPVRWLLIAAAAAAVVAALCAFAWPRGRGRPLAPRRQAPKVNLD